MRITSLTGVFEIPEIDPRRPHPGDMLGLALDTIRLMPTNGLRYPMSEGSSGWYIWGGETFSQTADFFTPIQVRDLNDYIPNLSPYLDLPPGYRFKVDSKGQMDAWFDGSLLDV